MAKISFSANIQGSNRERAEAETRSKVDAEIWEKTENTRKAREAKAKYEADIVERERAWAEAKATTKEIADISKVYAETMES